MSVTAGVYPALDVWERLTGDDQRVHVAPEDWRCAVCHAPALPLKAAVDGNKLTLACRHPVADPLPVNRYTARYQLARTTVALVIGTWLG